MFNNLTANFQAVPSSTNHFGTIVELHSQVAINNIDYICVNNLENLNKQKVQT